jgi:hypothetical protein
MSIDDDESWRVLVLSKRALHVIELEMEGDARGRLHQGSSTATVPLSSIQRIVLKREGLRRQANGGVHIRGVELWIYVNQAISEQLGQEIHLPLLKTDYDSRERRDKEIDAFAQALESAWPSP